MISLFPEIGVNLRTGSSKKKKKKISEGMDKPALYFEYFQLMIN